MGDSNHLEKMAKELKCPICLSLFSSAVSLSCNHVFCNECIVNAMKMDATCPVCKIPYHRREIRGAPHMDSLVSIYKSMEDASGVNIPESSNKTLPLDKGKNVRGVCVKKANEKKRQGVGKCVTKKKKRCRKTKEGELDALGSIVMKPSSQTKKRVQLLQNSSSESLTKSDEKLKNDYTIRLNEDPCVNKQGDMAPFFWLRDEDDDEEGSSQRTASDQLSDTTPVDVPSFSDLKDSDHDSPSKGDEQEKPNPGEMFDSEMFEWTQRPCSPEVLPSPVKAKVVTRGGIDRTQRKLSNVVTLKDKKRKAGSGRKTVARLHVGVAKEDYMESSVGAKTGEKQDSHGTSDTITRKDEKPDENVEAKRVTRSKGKSSGVQFGLNVSTEADGKQGTKRKRSSAKSSPAQPVAVSNELSHGTKTAGKGDKDQVHDSSDAQPENQSPTKKSSLRKSGRKSNATSLPKDLCGSTEKNTSEKRLKVDSGSVPSKVTQLRGKKILSDELNQVGDKQLSTNKKNSTVDEGNHTKQVLEKCSTIKKRPLEGNHTKQVIEKFTCAFCQSSEDTEASGEMAHYHKGEPVSADFTGGYKVIHVHKNCAEWAPNVYFNDLTAVNLDVELTRSRRISCSCCGLKGAALGCYNKGCKNSFHVTCATLMPECRWDDVNFVMLCPLDASSKLPCEETTSPKEGKRKCTPKVTSPNQVARETNIVEPQRKPIQGLPKKFVLSCSGLTVEEKGVVTDFAELSGVTILRKWEPSVTHVIASVNENGACKRTLKFMMAIMEGKWILNIDWIKECMKNKKYISEEPYEISMDVHGIQQGPYLGRQRALNKKPKLFNGLKFYIMGDFEVAYKGYLEDLIVAAGGTILRRRPISNDNEAASSTIIVFSVEPSKNKSLTERRTDGEALAKSARARAASSSWVLDSIAGCQILGLM